jgi:hypothetical protein
VTIAITIKTGSAVVFAADSKVTTTGLVGFKEDGEPNWVIQTYDNAYKVARDRERRLMAMVAGHANVGALPATDFINAVNFPESASVEEQDSHLHQLLQQMEAESRSYWQTSKLAEDQWPGPVLVFASAAPERRTARVWSGSIQGGKFTLNEILPEPGIFLEGSYSEVFALLYGIDFRKAPDVGKLLGVEDEKFIEAWKQSKVLSPIDKLNLYAMPAQDAMELAEFLATLQVEMDRFLPGEAACGGPIDLMVLQLFPQPTIVEFLGKTLHHPGASR